VSLPASQSVAQKGTLFPFQMPSTNIVQNALIKKELLFVKVKINHLKTVNAYVLIFEYWAWAHNHPSLEHDIIPIILTLIFPNYIMTSTFRAHDLEAIRQ
jgi:hypothetical protein